MGNTLSNLDEKLHRIIRVIGKEADRRRWPAYIVGGIVRDILLKKKNLDLDISVEGDAIALARGLAKKTKARLIIYKKFKTASLQWPGGIRVDLATVRKEHYPHSGALPIVGMGSLREDLFRRDFTINAMAIAINATCFGQLIDEFGGLKDLLSKKIRILHDQSYVDDPTRILRAVRFEQRLNFQIERQTLSKLKSALKKNIVANVKPPRYFSEFKKILWEQKPVKPLRRLHRLGGLRFLNPRIAVRFQELIRVHDRIQKLKRKPLYKQYEFWWLIYFVALIAEFSDRATGNILEKFHFSRTEQKTIQQSREAGDLIKRLAAGHLSASQIYQILTPLTEEMIIYLRVRISKALVGRRIDRYLSHDIKVRLQINGEDLKKIGISSGQEMGYILKLVLCSKIDRQVRSKRDEIKKALQSLEKY